MFRLGSPLCWLARGATSEAPFQQGVGREGQDRGIREGIRLGGHGPQW